MNKSARFTLMISAAALFAGCGGSQPPIGAPGAMPQSRATVTHAEFGASWMLPEARSIKRLLYISDDKTNHVLVYDFARGAKVGELTGFSEPRGQCVDAQGDVWITSDDRNDNTHRSPSMRTQARNPSRVLPWPEKLSDAPFPRVVTLRFLPTSRAASLPLPSMCGKTVWLSQPDRG
jgi:hypothetical protein